VSNSTFAPETLDHDVAKQYVEETDLAYDTEEKRAREEGTGYSKEFKAQIQKFRMHRYSSSYSQIALIPGYDDTLPYPMLSAVIDYKSKELGSEYFNPNHLSVQLLWYMFGSAMKNVNLAPRTGASTVLGLISDGLSYYKFLAFQLNSPDPENSLQNIMWEKTLLYEQNESFSAICSQLHAYFSFMLNSQQNAKAYTELIASGETVPPPVAGQLPVTGIPTLTNA